MRIYLRPITLEDGKLIVKWRNTPSVVSHCFDKRAVTEESNKMFFHDFIETGKYKQFIVERIDEDFGVSSYPIATVYLKDLVFWGILFVFERMGLWNLSFGERPGR